MARRGTPPAQALATASVGAARPRSQRKRGPGRAPQAWRARHEARGAGAGVGGAWRGRGRGAARRAGATGAGDSAPLLSEAGAGGGRPARVCTVLGALGGPGACGGARLARALRPPGGGRPPGKGPHRRPPRLPMSLNRGAACWCAAPAIQARGRRGQAARPGRRGMTRLGRRRSGKAEKGARAREHGQAAKLGVAARAGRHKARARPDLKPRG
jgi:hypothetical protein